MVDSNKIMSFPACFSPENSSEAELPLTVSLEPNPEITFDPERSFPSLLENILSRAPHSLFGFAQLFAPADASPSPPPARLSANPSSIYFGQWNVYQSASQSFRVTNNGGQVANLMLSTISPYSVSPGRAIKPGGTESFIVFFNPIQPGTFNRYVTGSHGISIALSGSAANPFKR